MAGRRLRNCDRRIWKDLSLCDKELESTAFVVRIPVREQFFEHSDGTIRNWRNEIVNVRRNVKEIAPPNERRLVSTSSVEILPSVIELSVEENEQMASMSCTSNLEDPPENYEMFKNSLLLQRTSSENRRDLKKNKKILKQKSLVKKKALSVKAARARLGKLNAQSHITHMEKGRVSAAVACVIRAQSEEIFELKKLVRLFENEH